MMQKPIDHLKGSSDRTRKPLGSERGVALVMVLVLSAVSLIVMTTVLYVILVGTQMSGSEKRYRTAHEAALGGIDILRPIIQAQAAIIPPGVSITYQGTQFTDKIAAASLAGFATNKIDVEINPLVPDTYDLYIDLGSPVYRVYAKMTQKQQGNTNKGYKQVRVKTGVVPAEPGMGEIHFTYYTFNILAQKAANPNERVRMDLVHIF
jgi:hypothetical protein